MYHQFFLKHIQKKSECNYRRIIIFVMTRRQFYHKCMYLKFEFEADADQQINQMLR